jgi:hypothetical protein
MDPALQQWLTETVEIAPYTGQDGYGKPAYGPAHVVPCRTEAQARVLMPGTGREAVSNTLLFLDGTVAITMRDQVRFADGTTPPIQRLDPVRDIDGSLSHYEVYF